MFFHCLGIGFAHHKHNSEFVREKAAPDVISFSLVNSLFKPMSLRTTYFVIDIIKTQGSQWGRIDYDLVLRF